MTNQHDLKPGDFCQWRDGHSRYGTLKYGIVRRVGAKSITAQPLANKDGTYDKVVVHRRQRYGSPWQTLVHVTPEAIALKTWLDAAPKGERMHVSYCGDGTGVHVSVGRLETPDDIDRATSELARVRSWLTERPKP